MDKIKALLELIDKLKPRDQDFARSLVDQSQSGRQLSEKQMVWVDRLIQFASPDVTITAVSEAAVKSVIDLIARNNKAKWPKIRVLVGETILQISRAGERSRYPGTLNVVQLTDAKELDRSSHDKNWLGRIHLDGRFERSRSLLEKDYASLIVALRKLGENPEAAALEYGKKLGHCCFCDLSLDDARSLEVGYGPTCAKNYRLKWGTAKPRTKADKFAELQQVNEQLGALRIARNKSPRDLALMDGLERRHEELLSDPEVYEKEMNRVYARIERGEI